jgi:hypothetical protein
MQHRFPELPVHQHVRDAAAALDRGQHDGAQRHLHAAIASLSPLQIRRAGVSDDDGHRAAKIFMDQAHRHLLLTKDNADLPAAQQSAQPQGSRQFAGMQHAIELAARVREEAGI